MRVYPVVVSIGRDHMYLDFDKRIIRLMIDGCFKETDLLNEGGHFTFWNPITKKFSEFSFSEHQEITKAYIKWKDKTKSPYVGCNCGSKHTSNPNHHYDWCNCHINPIKK